MTQKDILNALYKLLAAIMQKKLAAAMDDKLQKTQFDFRKIKF